MIIVEVLLLVKPILNMNINGALCKIVLGKSKTILIKNLVLSIV